MQPDNMRTIAFFGPNSRARSSLMFKFAAQWAEQGRKVLYISATGVTQIPPQIHGTSPLSSDTLKNIRFLHLPGWQDLLKHMYSLHTHAHIAQVILVEDLEHYLHDKVPNEMHWALIFASLIDATSVSAKRLNKQAIFVCAIDDHTIHSDKLHHTTDAFFNDIVCVIKQENRDSDGEPGISVTKIVPAVPVHTQRTKLEFIEDSEKGTLMLKKIIELVNLDY